MPNLDRLFLFPETPHRMDRASALSGKTDCLSCIIKLEQEKFRLYDTQRYIRVIKGNERRIQVGFLKFLMALAFISESRYEEDKDKNDEYAYHHLMEELEEDDHELDNTDEEGDGW